MYLVALRAPDQTPSYAGGVALITDPVDVTRSGATVIRVHELARELGVRVAVVLQAARDKEIRYLRTASSPVPKADADAIRAWVRRGNISVRADSRDSRKSRSSRDAKPAGPAASPEERHAAAMLGLDPTSLHRVDPEVAATAAALGVEFSSGGRATYRQSGKRQTGAQRAMLRPEEPTGMAAVIRQQWSSITPAQAERLAASYAAKNVTADAARPYWAGGLGPYDVDAIAQCIHSGLQPADLALLIDGRSVVNRLRGGEPVQVLLVQLPH